jgi:hypothetical protein
MDDEKKAKVVVLPPDLDATEILPEDYLKDVNALDEAKVKTRMDKIRQNFTSGDGSCLISDQALRLLAAAEMGVYLSDYYEFKDQKKDDHPLTAMDLRDISLDHDGTYMNIKAVIIKIEDAVSFKRKSDGEEAFRTPMQLRDPTNHEVKRYFTYWGKLPEEAITVPQEGIITNVKVSKYSPKGKDVEYISLSSTRNTKFEVSE